MISFDNTQIAFSYKTDGELHQSRILFSTIGNSAIVKIGNVLVNTALKLGVPIKWAVKPTIYKHFVGGETISECQPTIDKLARSGVKSILDYSVEGKEAIEDIEKALAETLRAVNYAATNPDIPFAVFKPTAFARSVLLEKANANQLLSIGEQRELDDFVSRIDKLCSAAFSNNIPILIDAEDSWYQDLFDRVVEQMMLKYNRQRAIVYNTLQMYRHDRLDFLKQSHAKAVEKGYYLGVKFVRGAYMEKERERAAQMGYPSPINPDKATTDNCFNSALEYSVDNIDNISIFNGTHNEYSSRYLTELMVKKGLSPNDSRVWFSQLYGMSDNISFNIAAAGYNVAKYLPYGPVNYVMPYLLRRAAENTSVKGQTGRELNLILTEIKRRKASDGNR